ncbi:hypothetical protein WS83_21145 [Burkholderia sp. MSMB2042]|uniref:Uncharacterized protein n=1 Tax=Burkholderia savannae TaxID=1637837 RepID=A0ABR5T753_9BURK|nr:hypothetical protein [Burkholderia savannae]KVH00847.1 hypothetical protein WS83_21145 [Burkholderia sp. MSMB2042]KWZ39052.1 hypothetical protein WS72_30260 [Burkholderia savannae]
MLDAFASIASRSMGILPDGDKKSDGANAHRSRGPLVASRAPRDASRSPIFDPARGCGRPVFREEGRMRR